MTSAHSSRHHGFVVVSGPLGFNPFSSIASGVKAVGKGIVKTHVIGTKAIMQVAKNKQVQQAAVQAGQQYAQQKYGAQYAKGLDYYQKGKALLRPPGAPGGPPPPEALDEEGDPIPSPGGVPAQKGNLMLIGGLAAAAVLVFVLTR